MGNENLPETINSGVCNEFYSPIRSEGSSTCSVSRHSIEKEGLSACRVCQCTESDKRGDAALEFLCINPTLENPCKRSEDVKPSCNDVSKDSETKDDRRYSRLVEFVSPNGEVFVCNTDIEYGFDHNNQDKLIELGCSCKNELGLVHYACALKWFVNQGSTICEICGCISKNITSADLTKVVGSLKEYETLKERTANGVPNLATTSSGVDPDALAAIRRQRLSEIALWFGLINNNSATASQVVDEQVSNVITEESVPTENPATKWAVEGTGILLLATGLLTVTLAWFIAPRVGKKTAKSGLHILLGGICALTVVVFFRFFVLTRIKYGAARNWAILFVFWFLVFGIWALRMHAT